MQYIPYLGTLCHGVTYINTYTYIMHPYIRILQHTYNIHPYIHTYFLTYISYIHTDIYLHARFGEASLFALELAAKASTWTMGAWGLERKHTPPPPSPIP
jgi:hypothetical protein